MNIDKLVPRKLSIAVVTLIMLERLKAPPLYIAIVGIAALTAQCILDYKENKNEISNDLPD